MLIPAFHLPTTAVQHGHARAFATASAWPERMHKSLVLLGVALAHLILFTWLVHDSERPQVGLNEGLSPIMVLMLEAEDTASPPLPAPPMPSAPERPRPRPRAEPQRPEAAAAAAPVVESAIALPASEPEPSPDVAPAPTLPLSDSAESDIAASDSAPAPESSPASRRSAGPGLEQRWQLELLRHLDRHLRYPQLARRRHQQGITQVRFRVDLAGRLAGSALERSSGHALLDQEALAVLVRAQPLPPPPPELARVDVVLPITFRVRHSR